MTSILSLAVWRTVFSTLSLTLAALSAIAASFATDARAANIIIDTVPIGNAGNAPDPLTGNLYGGVNYDYRIGTTEVTNAQYVAFLNEKAKSDPYTLYSGAMSDQNSGGIDRSGSGTEGSPYVYSLKPDMGDKPVGFVTWYDAIRFANWLHNGQGVGDTETGAYTLGQLGDYGIPANGNSIVRNPGATWFLPSEDEWYKAAYHQPAAQGGDSDDYWLYPSASNTVPTSAIANSVGDVSNPGENVAIYANGTIWNGGTNVATVGGAGPLSDSFYGTVDQGGNVFEWNDSSIGDSVRGLRGGSYLDEADILQSSYRGITNPQFGNGYGNFGFRVATIPVPEPNSLILLGIGGCAAVGVAFSTRKRHRN